MMKFALIQLRKDLFDADFTVVRQGEEIGYAQVRDWTLTKAGIMRIVFDGTEYILKRKVALLNPYNPDHEYSILENGEYIGSVYMKATRKGFFHFVNSNRMTINGKEYIRFGIGLGKEGNCSPIYDGDLHLQVAQFRIDTEVYNDCWCYRCSAINKEYAVIALLFSCYSYIDVAYRLGEKAQPSIKLHRSITKNKEELRYYDPYFEDRVEV